MARLRADGDGEPHAGVIRHGRPGGRVSRGEGLLALAQVALALQPAHPAAGRDDLGDAGRAAGRALGQSEAGRHAGVGGGPGQLGHGGIAQRHQALGMSGRVH